MFEWTMQEFESPRISLLAAQHNRINEILASSQLRDKPHIYWDIACHAWCVAYVINNVRTSNVPQVNDYKLMKHAFMGANELYKYHYRSKMVKV